MIARVITDHQERKETWDSRENRENLALWGFQVQYIDRQIDSGETWDSREIRESQAPWGFQVHLRYKKKHFFQIGMFKSLLFQDLQDCLAWRVPQVPTGCQASRERRVCPAAREKEGNRAV